MALTSDLAELLRDHEQAILKLLEYAAEHNPEHLTEEIKIVLEAIRKPGNGEHVPGRREK